MQMFLIYQIFVNRNISKFISNIRIELHFKSQEKIINVAIIFEMLANSLKLIIKIIYMLKLFKISKIEFSKFEFQLADYLP